MDDVRRSVPATSALLLLPPVADACERLGRRTVIEVIRGVQQSCRDGALAPDEVTAEVLRRLPGTAGQLRPVVNATGVVVHTNLGRAPLSAAAVDALVAAAGATDVELDLATGRRGPRGTAVARALARAVPQAGAAHVVNNGAAALALTAATLAGAKNVVVARGELVEIGDGFRIPELLEATGARIREVGTTNRVRLDDYAAAIDDRTGFVLKVHPSNFVVRGFTSSVGVVELSALDAPLVVDIGSGLLAPHPRLVDEPDAATTLDRGADLVTCSGDKLLGGPQCGLLLGRADLVQRIRRHPLARAYRVDKLTLAALAATLDGPTPPVERALAVPVTELRARATAIAAAVADATPVEVVDSRGAVGGGGAPEVTLESVAVSLDGRLGELLRRQDPAVVGRTHRGRLLLDLLAVQPEQDDTVVASVRSAAAALSTRGTTVPASRVDRG